MNSTNQEEFIYNNGTIVTVRSLFGNLPVRLKYFASRFEKLAEVEGEFESLKKRVVGLELAASSTFKLRIIESWVQKRYFNQSDITSQGRFSFPRIFASLTRARYPLSEDESNWKLASAKTSSARIRAAISLTPVPSKFFQFISIGQYPLESDKGGSIFMDEINKIFEKSSFGMLEDDVDVPEAEILRRTADKRFKNESHSSRQLQGLAKGADRWPMFYIRIDVKDASQSTNIAEGLQPSAVFKNIVETLRGLIREFLLAHGFRLRRQWNASRLKVTLRPSEPLSKQKLTLSGRNHNSNLTALTGVVTEHVRSGDISETWLETDENKTSSDEPLTYPSQLESTMLSRGRDALRMPTSSDTASGHSSMDESAKLYDTRSGDESGNEDISDETTAWMDPRTRAESFPGRRTGLVTHQISSESLNWRTSKSKSQFRNLVHSSMASTRPRFEPPIRTILSASESDSMTMAERELEISESLRYSEYPVSKDDLRKAIVIAQVDKKFLLARLPISDRDLLILLDQHAADERVKVEELLKKLCDRNTIQLQTHILFDVSEVEVQRFRAWKQAFHTWGIEYNFRGQGRRSLAVTALPTVIAERCRTEPRVLIDLLRREIWKPVCQSIPDGPWMAKVASCPQGIVDLVNSRACRAAVMFNDALSVEEGQELMRNLAKCQLPFQCAHGRPSIVTPVIL